MNLTHLEPMVYLEAGYLAVAAQLDRSNSGVDLDPANSLSANGFWPDAHVTEPTDRLYRFSLRSPCVRERRIDLELVFAP